MSFNTKNQICNFSIFINRISSRRSCFRYYSYHYFIDEAHDYAISVNNFDSPDYYGVFLKHPKFIVLLFDSKNVSKAPTIFPNSKYCPGQRITNSVFITAETVSSKGASKSLDGQHPQKQRPIQKPLPQGPNFLFSSVALFHS